MSFSLGSEEIKKLLPHRYPFLFVDRIEDIILGESATGIKNVSINEWYFQGHFPNQPIFPGVLIIEAMAQTAGALVVKTIGFEEENPPLVYFMSVQEAKFRKPVYPGDVLLLKVFKEHHRKSVWKFKGKAWVNEILSAEATFTAMIPQNA